MTDKEILLIAYGALKLTAQRDFELQHIVDEIENHLFPETTVFTEDKLPDENDEAAQAAQ